MIPDALAKAAIALADADAAVLAAHLAYRQASGKEAVIAAREAMETREKEFAARRAEYAKLRTEHNEHKAKARESFFEMAKRIGPAHAGIMLAQARLNPPSELSVAIVNMLRERGPMLGQTLELALHRLIPWDELKSLLDDHTIMQRQDSKYAIACQCCDGTGQDDWYSDER